MAASSTRHPRFAGGNRRALGNHWNHWNTATCNLFTIAQSLNLIKPPSPRRWWPRQSPWSPCRNGPAQPPSGTARRSRSTGRPDSLRGSCRAGCGCVYAWRHQRCNPGGEHHYATRRCSSAIRHQRASSAALESQPRRYTPMHNVRRTAARACAAMLSMARCEPGGSHRASCPIRAQSVACRLLCFKRLETAVLPLQRRLDAVEARVHAAA